MAIIQIKNLTKDYGHNRGVFDVSFSVKRGEVYGFLGPNGAGKTTVIRHVMGFTRPQKGQTIVNGLDCWDNANEIQKNLGYLPGEIALPESLTGTEFIHMMADLRGLKDMAHTKYLIERFDLDPKGSLKRMSLGMKRKLAIVTAFMHNPDVLILDEPTSGLDPIMQDIFIEFIKEEKARGKTILISSHIFNEVDATCDTISIIKDGHLISTVVADELRQNKNKTFNIEFNSHAGFGKFNTIIETYKNFEVVSLKSNKNQVKISVNDQYINEFIDILSNFDLKFFSEIKFTLENYFMKYYDRTSIIEEGVE